MHDALTKYIRKWLASLIAASCLALTFHPVPANAGNDSKDCQPTVPRELSSSQFDEFRKKIWETGTTMHLKLSFKTNFNIKDYPFFLLLAAGYVDRNEPIEALSDLEVLDLAPNGASLCQYIFAHEILSALRYAAIKLLIADNTRNSRSWDGFGYGAMRYFSLNDYENAKCIVLNTDAGVLKLDREPTFKEYPRDCMVR